MSMVTRYRQTKVGIKPLRLNVGMRPRVKHNSSLCGLIVVWKEDERKRLNEQERMDDSNAQMRNKAKARTTEVSGKRTTKKID